MIWPDKIFSAAYILISFYFYDLTSHDSAWLSMLPWPKPSVWPSVPPDASSEVLAKEKVSCEYGMVKQSMSVS